MSARNKKQSPGLYARLNTETQLMEQRTNRKLRRKNLARARKIPGEYRELCKQNRLHQTVKASRIYQK